MIIAALTAGALTLMAPWDGGGARAALLERVGAEAFQIAARTQASHRWFSFAADWDSATTWPKGLTIVLSLKDGRRLKAATVMAMTPLPEARPIVLGLEPRRLEPSQLQHGRNGRCMLLVSFPDPNIGLGDIRGLSLEARRPGGGVP
jgi:hypothetical protein